MDLYRSLLPLFEQWLQNRFCLKILISFLIVSGLPQGSNGVINGKMKDRGLYVIQSVAEPRYVLTVADDTFEKIKLEGELLNQVMTSKWRNDEEQKWTVKLFGKQYYFLTPVDGRLNNVTYKIYMEEFPIPNIWELHSVHDSKHWTESHWMIKMNRGKCLRFAGTERPVKLEKCDKKNEHQLWNFHLLNQ